KPGLPAARIEHVEKTVLRGNDRGKLRQDQAADRMKALLALEHPAELGGFGFHQSSSGFFPVVSRKFLIISLAVSFNAATSPRASTVIDRVRSPCVTAVATSAIARTW